MKSDIRQANLYLDLLKKTLLYQLWEEPGLPASKAMDWFSPTKRFIIRSVDHFLSKHCPGLQLTVKSGHDKKAIEAGRVWPVMADTMIGLKRLDNIQHCVEAVLKSNTPGDLIETGVWRGGACIFMKAVLKAYDESDRRVFVADSFQGLPKPDSSKFPEDDGDTHYLPDALRVSRQEVEANFLKYDLLDDRVVFLEGWFNDTLPNAPIKKIAVLRLDGDMYQSTIESMTHLYPKLAVGGFCIIDDYTLSGCRKAVEDYRRQSRISEPIREIDIYSFFWQRAS